MPVNLDKPHLWKVDIAQSVDLYNDWFMNFAPRTYRETRVRVTKDVEAMLRRTQNLSNVTPTELREHPGILPALRMSTAPPLARDRLVGLASVKKSLVETMEKDGILPARLGEGQVETELRKIAALFGKLADVDIFHWLPTGAKPTKGEVRRAATIVADRLCGSQADPIVRNAQETRQLCVIKAWLEGRGYADHSGRIKLDEMEPGMFAFRLPVAGMKEDATPVNIPVDVVVQPTTSQPGALPLMIEAKSAGDFTNVNKRRKEEATKVQQLRRKYGSQVRYVLFLCGYFDTGYLGYEAAEGIDWAWEHRIDDLTEFGL
jgi:hypothetical protein